MIARPQLVLLSLLLVGCPDDGPGQPDATVGEAGPDTGPVVLCDKTCTAKAENLCVLEPRSRRCLECMGDIHCKVNPKAYGPVCDTIYNLCSCTKDADCVGHSRGFLCDDTVQICSCLVDKDCPSHLRCQETLSYTGGWETVNICGPPCKEDQDCEDDAAPRCDTVLGKCVECRNNPDCATSSNGKYCSPTTGRCITCENDLHCSSPYYKFCHPTKGCVTCTKDSHCKAYASSMGHKCINNSCRCETNADCVGNRFGKLCKDFTKTRKFCGCTKDTDCRTEFTCTGKYLSSFDVCDGPCQSNEDCTSSSAPVCDPSNGTCVECAADKDCADNEDGAKCLASKTCGCAAAADCAGAAAKGKACSSSSCGCATSADCVGSSRGPTCDSSIKGCTCAKDGDCTAAGYTICAPGDFQDSYRVCRKPCKSDSDCKLVSKLSRCKTSSGKCVQCTSDEQCTTSKPFCSGAGLCLPCIDDKSCASNAFAKICTSDGCAECEKDGDCTSGSLGTTCKQALCSCATDSDCAANANGKSCDTVSSACGCAADKDCPSGKSCTSYQFIKICK